MAEPNFNNPNVHVQSWYVVDRATALRPGQVRSFDLLGRRIAVYRNSSGALYAVDGRCPHLGADLGQGRVEGSSLRCRLHGWRIGSDGACVSPAGPGQIEKRSVHAYPVVERWGIIWLFNGPEPSFDLPDLGSTNPNWVVRLPPQTIDCHPHLVIGNGLDVTHFSVLHDMELTATPRLDTRERFTTSLEIQGRPRAPQLRRATGTQRADIAARFTAIGGSLAVATVRAPIQFDVLFTGRTNTQGNCETRTLVFLYSRNPIYVTRALVILYTLLHNDRRVLDRLQFAPDWSTTDDGLRTFAAVIDRMAVW